MLQTAAANECQHYYYYYSLVVAMMMTDCSKYLGVLRTSYRGVRVLIISTLVASAS